LKLKALWTSNIAHKGKENQSEKELPTFCQSGGRVTRLRKGKGKLITDDGNCTRIRGEKSIKRENTLGGRERKNFHWKGEKKGSSPGGRKKSLLKHQNQVKPGYEGKKNQPLCAVVRMPGWFILKNRGGDWTKPQLYKDAVEGTRERRKTGP